MNNPLVSVIVPVYNVEKYLPRCITSILLQTYSNIELLLVNDGSTDRSGRICDDYEKADNRIKVIHKSNSGVSESRNAGIAVASGEFIVFVDSDDWLEKTAIEHMVVISAREQTEIVMMWFDHRNNKIIKPAFNITSNYMDVNTTKAECWKEFFQLYISHVVWGKLYSAEIIKKHNIRFDNNIAYGEDTIFLFEYLCCCEKLYISEKVVYHYNKLNDNAATRKYHENLIEGIFKYHVFMGKFVDKLNIKQNEKDAIMGWCAVKRILNLIYPYVYYLAKEQSLVNIEGCLIQFEKWLDTDDVWKYNWGKESRLVDAICDRDIERIYKEQRKLFEKTSPKQFVSTIVYQILKPVIERKRDGLITHKFKMKT